MYFPFVNYKRKNGLLLVLLCLVILFVFCSCNDVSDNVSRQENNSPSAEGFTYISPSELEGDVQKALEKGLTNFKLREGIQVELPEELTVCDFVYSTDYTKNADRVFKLFFDEQTLSAVSIVREDKDFYGEPMTVHVGFRDEASRIHCYVSDAGFVSLFRGDLFDSFMDGGSRVKLYHADRGDDLSDSYELAGEPVTVAEAVTFAQDWLSQTYAALEPNYKLRIKTVSVLQNDMGEYTFDLTAEKLYKGVALYDGVIYAESNAKNSKSKDGYRLYPNSLRLRIKRKGAVDGLTNSTGMVLPENKRKLDKVISLSSAMEYIQNKFTDFASPYEISDISLKYTLTPEYDASAPHNKPDDPGVKNIGHLVWEFVMDVPAGDLPDNGAKYGDVRRFIHIDAESGEMEYEFDVSLLKMQ